MRTVHVRPMWFFFTSPTLPGMAETTELTTKPFNLYNTSKAATRLRTLSKITGMIEAEPSKLQAQFVTVSTREEQAVYTCELQMA